MANWEKLNKEFDEALDSMTKEDWKSWYERFKQKQINQNKMTAVEWLWNALLVSGFQEIKNVEGFYHLAKQKEKEQKYSEEEVREMLFMVLYEPQEQCCTTHTKDSIVRKVLKTFKSE